MGSPIEGSAQAFNFTIQVNYIRRLSIVCICLKNCVNLARLDMDTHNVLKIVFKSYSRLMTNPGHSLAEAT
jgi:hypothetical protein